MCANGSNNLRASLAFDVEGETESGVGRGLELTSVSPSQGSESSTEHKQGRGQRADSLPLGSVQDEVHVQHAHSGHSVVR